ncbi:MAG: tetratricopeptide repeat protein, partial [Chthoniobacterales bacterium]
KAPTFFDELKRRNVYKVGVAYTVVAWLLIQVATQVFPFLQIPDWAIRLVIVLCALGFPIALVIAWAFELTPEGVKRTETAEALHAGSKGSHAWIYVVVLGSAAAITLFFVGRYSTTKTKADDHAPEKSIAVLPFESLSEDKTNAYFASGIQDEILTRLAKISDLKVISRTSTQQYQSKPGNLTEIARQLGVAHILEGSVQKAGDAVRVNVQLIRADGDTHLWAETYDRKLTDIFAVETEVAERIASSLRAQLSGGERAQIATVPTVNPQAYDAYLRGIELIKRQSYDDVRQGRDFLRRAVELDPNYAQAWAQISIAEAQLYFSVERTPACLERTRLAAETAVRLQPELSEARAALGVYYYTGLQDYDRAMTELEKALQISPNDASTLFYIGLVKRRQGKLEESNEFLRKAAVSDPRNQDIWSNMARSYRGKRDFATARELFDRAYAISPDEVQFMGEKAETYLAQGDLEMAGKVLSEVLSDPKLQEKRPLSEEIDLLTFRRRFNEALSLLTRKALDPSPVRAADDKAWEGILQIWAGHPAEGRVLLEQARSELLSERTAGETSLRLKDSILLTSAQLGDRAAVEEQVTQMLAETRVDAWRASESEEIAARAYATLGDADRAIPLLERCLAASYRRSLTPAYLRLDPLWDPIRKDPRFEKLTRGEK